MAPVSPATTHNPPNDISKPVRIAVIFGSLVLMVPFALQSYHHLDQRGWFTHSRVTGTYIDGNWMVGEYRNCTLSGNAAALSCQADPYSISEVGSWARNTHTLPVSFHGRIDQPDISSWRCQRKEEGLTCE